MPDQLKLGIYLWTRAAVVALIARDRDVTVSRTTVGRYLNVRGFSAQKPVRRAYERNDAAIAQWLTREYPAIVRDAKRDGATIYWGDEMGLSSGRWPGAQAGERDPPQGIRVFRSGGARPPTSVRAERVLGAKGADHAPPCSDRVNDFSVDQPSQRFPGARDRQPGPPRDVRHPQRPSVASEHSHDTHEGWRPEDVVQWLV